MEAIRVHPLIVKEGKVVVTDLPFKTGQYVEVIVLPRRVEKISRTRFEAKVFAQQKLLPRKLCANYVNQD
jgi:hypothetical protein